MQGWWCMRYGDALAWVEAPSEVAAVRRSFDLHHLGDWIEGVVCEQRESVETRE